MVCLSFYLLCFVLNKKGEQEGGTGSAWKRVSGEGEVAQIMYIHVSKCKNDKIKTKKRIISFTNRDNLTSSFLI
jgi:hypothetical protein